MLLAAALILPAAIMLCALAKALPGRYADGIRAKGCGQNRGQCPVRGIRSVLFGVRWPLISYFSHVVETWIPPHTDYRLIAAFITLICAYAISKDFTSLIRLVSFVGTLCVLAVLTVRLLMVFSSDTNNLLPLAEPQVLVSGIAEATGRLFAFFFCIGTLAIVPQGKRNKGSMLVVLLSVVCAALLLALVCAACIAVLGVPQTALYKDAMVLAMKTFDLSRSSFIQRADIIFIITWTLLILSAVCSVCYIPFVFIKNKRMRVRARLAARFCASCCL